MAFLLIQTIDMPHAGSLICLAPEEDRSSRASVIPNVSDYRAPRHLHEAQIRL